MVAVRAALNLKRGAAKEFYICSLSSRLYFNPLFSLHKEEEIFVVLS